MANNNENKILNVPHLRFPEFSGEWKKCKFGDIATGFDYGMNAAAKPFDGENKYIRITDIDEASSQYLYDDVVSPDGELGDSYLVKENDILLARTGASTGKSYLYRNSDGKLYFAGFLIRANIYKHNSYFVFSQLHTHRYKKWISVMSARSGQPGINSQEYASFPLYTTSLQEEDKIASFLKLLDERIATQNKIIDKFQSLIKGLAVALTTKGKPNTAISQCLECHSSALQESEVMPNGLYKVFGANGLVGYTDVPQMNGDAILVIKDGSGVGTVSYAQGKFSVIGTLNYLTVIGNNDLRYLYFALSVFNFQPYKTGMAIPHIYFKDYGKAKIYCPSLAEQKRVANVLDKLESKLFVEQELLASFNQQKLYLLGKMFI
ncbi:restriction endonuclease subunit S [Bacteroides fragilis]|uniref:restriction endonuclease subunit S n=2 Tax=Bacteroides TaxID=816 RepID=UPI001CE2094A|nr:restriction endonuclease subunit S [Bacteroides fragilis]MCA5611464.1 restriction endonuclease subunit S [Bacteroides fragilis]MCS2961998.1 restriction endonuclease subunit S [Bacteroides thetaiotaomicron]